MVFTIVIFILFGDRPSGNNLVSYGLIVGAVYFSFRG